MLWLAIHLHLHRLPQLKGKGKIINPDARSDAARLSRMPSPISSRSAMCFF